MLQRFLKFFKRSKHNIKPGIDIEIINRLAIIRIDVGKLSPSRIGDFLQKQIDLLGPDLKSDLGVDRCIFYPYTKD